MFLLLSRSRVVPIFMFVFVAFSLVIFLSPKVYGQIEFTNIDASDLKTINKEFSSTFAYSSLTGPASLGSIFGVEVGVVGGMADTPGIERLAKEVNANNSVSFLPHAWLMGAVTVPFGITVEANFLPEIDAGDFEFNHMGLAGKWTVTDIFPLPAPVNVAVLLSYTSSELTFNQTISSVDTTVSFDNSMFAYGVMGSVNLLVFEPYVGLGNIAADSDLGVTGATSIFDATYTTSTTASDKESSTYFQIGAQAKLLLLRFGVEYMNAFGGDRYSAKISLKF